MPCGWTLADCVEERRNSIEGVLYTILGSLDISIAEYVSFVLMGDENIVYRRRPAPTGLQLQAVPINTALHL